MFAEFGVLNYLTYLVGAIFIILVPGPNTFFVLKTGVAHGVKKGYLAAAGVFIGDAILMFLAFAGVATLIKTTPVLFNIVRYLGGDLSTVDGREDALRGVDAARWAFVF